MRALFLALLCLPGCTQGERRPGPQSSGYVSWTVVEQGHTFILFWVKQGYGGGLTSEHIPAICVGCK